VWKNIPMDRDKVRTGINELINVAKNQNHHQIAEKIKELVPEYIGENSELQSESNKAGSSKEGTRITTEKNSD